MGYEKSFEQNFGVTPSEFYKEFDDFLNKSDEAKQNILKVNWFYFDISKSDNVYY